MWDRKRSKSCIRDGWRRGNDPEAIESQLRAETRDYPLIQGGQRKLANGENYTRPVIEKLSLYIE